MIEARGFHHLESEAVTPLQQGLSRWDLAEMTIVGGTTNVIKV